MKILFASSNHGKIFELNNLFAGSVFEILSTSNSDYPPIEVAETGNTFSENAELKARAYAERYLLPTLADDSGLEVVELNNKPGVQSNRWFAGSDKDRNVELLRLLEGKINRIARFVTVACAYFPESKNCHFFEGTIDGTISTDSRGSQGFGYDPIFVPIGYNQTFAELGVEEKNKLSHRARAFEQVKKFLNNYEEQQNK